LFTPCYAVGSALNPLADEFIKGFQVFDKAGNGFIGAGELRYVLTQLGEKMSDDEVDELLKGFPVQCVSVLVAYRTCQAGGFEASGRADDGLQGRADQLPLVRQVHSRPITVHVGWEAMLGSPAAQNRPSRGT
jgi:hypothetical protein